MALSDWSAVAADNGTTLGVNIAEGCPAANVNNAMRQMMADVAGGINVSLLGTFLSSTTLSQARTALGVAEGSTSMTNFSALTNAANKLPYMTGSDAWSTTTLTSFARTLLDDGDAATAQNTLGAVGIVASSIASGSGYIKFNIGGTTFILQWKDVTVTSGTGTTAMTYPVAFASFAKVWVEGTNDESGDSSAYVQRSTITTSGCTLSNAASASQTVTVFAIGV